MTTLSFAYMLLMFSTWWGLICSLPTRLCTLLA